jgi:hypothetical protein
MARSRNIKPGFFKNETLAELPPLARLLFAGLWTIADRCGRLEDRPKRIKTEVLAYDECDVNGLLQGLHDKGFILRYKNSRDTYIQILSWTKHQNPHMKEVPSTIPAPTPHQISTGLSGTSTIPAPDKNSSSTGISGTSPSLTLIPSSLIPLTLNPESGVHRADKSDPDKITGVSNNTVSIVDPWGEFDFEDWFNTRWAKHPNKNFKNQGRQTLATHPKIYDPAWRAQFERAQDAWAATDSWRWNNGAKCPPMYQWVNDEGFDFMPSQSGTSSGPGPPKQSAQMAAIEASRRSLEEFNLSDVEIL